MFFFSDPPVYVNMNDLANMAAQKHREREQRETEHEIPLSDSQDTTPTEAHPEPHQRRQEANADTNQQQVCPTSLTNCVQICQDTCQLEDNEINYG